MDDSYFSPVRNVELKKFQFYFFTSLQFKTKYIETIKIWKGYLGIDKTIIPLCLFSIFTASSLACD